MTATPTQVMMQLIRDLGLVSTGWVVVNANLPNDQNNVIVITRTTGVYHGKDEDGVPYVQNGFQVRVRGVDGPTAEGKCQAVFNALVPVKLRTVTVGTEDVVVWNFQPTTDPSFMTQEENARRQHWVLNGLLTIST